MRARIALSVAFHGLDNTIFDLVDGTIGGAGEATQSIQQINFLKHLQQADSGNAMDELVGQVKSQVDYTRGWIQRRRQQTVPAYEGQEEDVKDVLGVFATEILLSSLLVHGWVDIHPSEHELSTHEVSDSRVRHRYSLQRF